MRPRIETPPRTIMEVFKSLPEGTLAEVINNQIYMSPSPVYKHQDVLLGIASKLRNYLKESDGKVVIAPFDVYLDETSNAVQPDIVIILKNNAGTFHQGYFHGVPDILVEILSANNRDHDLIRKRDLYERFGVREYWIVDPENKSTSICQLENKSYRVSSEDVGVISSKVLGRSFAF